MLLKTVINSTRMNYKLYPPAPNQPKPQILFYIKSPPPAGLYCKDFDTIYVCGVYLSNIGVTNG